MRRSLIKKHQNDKNKQFDALNNAFNQRISNYIQIKRQQMNKGICASKAPILTMDLSSISKCEFDDNNTNQFVTNYILQLMGIINNLDTYEYPFCQQQLFQHFGIKASDARTLTSKANLSVPEEWYNYRMMILKYFYEKNIMQPNTYDYNFRKAIGIQPNTHDYNFRNSMDTPQFDLLNHYYKNAVIQSDTIVNNYLLSTIEIIKNFFEGKNPNKLLQSYRETCDFFYKSVCDFYYLYILNRGYPSIKQDSSRGRQNEWFVHHIFPFITDMLILYKDLKWDLDTLKKLFFDIIKNYLHGYNQKENEYTFRKYQNYISTIKPIINKDGSETEYKIKERVEYPYKYIHIESLKQLLCEIPDTDDGKKIKRLFKILQSGGTGYILIQMKPEINEFLYQCKCKNTIQSCYKILYENLIMLLRDLPSYKELDQSTRNVVTIEDGGDLISMYKGEIYFIDSKNNVNEKNDDDWGGDCLKAHTFQLIIYTLNYTVLLVPQEIYENLEQYCENCYMLFFNPSKGFFTYGNLYLIFEGIDKNENINIQKYKIYNTAIDLFKNLKRILLNDDGMAIE